MIYDVIGMITTVIFINYAVAPVTLLHWDPILVYLRTMQFSGHILLLVGLLAATFLYHLDSNPKLKHL